MGLLSAFLLNLIMYYYRVYFFLIFFFFLNSILLFIIYDLFTCFDTLNGFDPIIHVLLHNIFTLFLSPFLLLLQANA
jgi:hypothetical protein